MRHSPGRLQRFPGRRCDRMLFPGEGAAKTVRDMSAAEPKVQLRSTAGWRAHLDTTTNIPGSAKRNAAFTLQHGSMLTPRQPEGCVPVVVSKWALGRPRAHNRLDTRLVWSSL